MKAAELKKVEFELSEKEQARYQQVLDRIIQEQKHGKDYWIDYQFLYGHKFLQEALRRDGYKVEYDRFTDHFLVTW